MAKTPTTFVLVHGAWWSGENWWQGVTKPLQAADHRVFTPVLTGLGPRAHLLTPAVNLSTHILDVANLIKWEQLSNIVLVGHSSGGMVISGVAETVPPGTIRSLVYLDALVPQDGQSLLDIMGDFGPLAGNDPLIAPPSVAFAAGNKKVEAILVRLGTPQPRATMAERIRLTGAAERVENKIYVRATKNSPSPCEPIAERLRRDPTWRVVEIPCGHLMMIDMPRETAEILLRAAEP